MTHGSGGPSPCATPCNVARWKPEDIGEFKAGVQLVTDGLGLPRPMPPASLFGVEILVEPDVPIEVEATAVLA